MNQIHLRTRKGKYFRCVHDSFRICGWCSFAEFISI